MQYVINNSKIPNLFLNKWSWHRYQKHLDEFSMSNALDGMIGEHDFFAFQKSGSNRSTSVTTIKHIKEKPAKVKEVTLFTTVFKVKKINHLAFGESEIASASLTLIHF